MPQSHERNTQLLSGKDTQSLVSECLTSVKGDILKNVVLILSSRGENDKAIALMKEARLENPTDITLVRAEAEMVYKMGDIARYDELMQQVLAI